MVQQNMIINIVNNFTKKIVPFHDMPNVYQTLISGNRAIETKYLHTLINCTYESTPKSNRMKLRKENNNLMHENNTKHNNINKRKDIL